MPKHADYVQIPQQDDQQDSEGDDDIGEVLVDADHDGARRHRPCPVIMRTRSSAMIAGR